MRGCTRDGPRGPELHGQTRRDRSRRCTKSTDDSVVEGVVRKGLVGREESDSPKDTTGHEYLQNQDWHRVLSVGTGTTGGEWMGCLRTRGKSDTDTLVK